MSGLKKLVPIAMGIILLLVAALGWFNTPPASAADESLLPYIPRVTSIYRETRPDVNSWVIRVDFGATPYWLWPTTRADMQAPTSFGRYVDDWNYSDPVGHWIFWWDDWTGLRHYVDVGSAIRRSTGEGGTLIAAQGETVVGTHIELSDGRFADNCYYRALPIEARVKTGTIMPWQGESLNQVVCNFQYPQPPTPTPTATPVATATPTPCCPPPPPAGCIALEQHHSPNGDWYPGQTSGLVEVHVWWPNFTQERKLLLESWQRPGFINGGGSAWSWPVGCEQGARSAFQNQAAWIPQVSLDQLRNEGRTK